MTSPLRVGVIGLGPRWRRQYRPALRGLRDAFQVSAVCDQVHDRAARAAKRLGCAAAGGPTDLLQREDVDALLLLDSQWHGLWSAELACRMGKPVFCCPPEALAAAEAEAVRREADTAGVPVLLALPLRALPAAARLRELLAGSLGEARVAMASTGASDEGAAPSPLDLTDLCAMLFAAEPVRVTPLFTSALSAFVLEYQGDRVAHLTMYRTPVVPAPVRLEIIAEHGRAVLHGPHLLSWTDREGQHAHRPARPVAPARVLLEQFALVAAQRQPPSPSLEELVRLLNWFPNAPALARPGA
jgi:hypothetical protein